MSEIQEFLHPDAGKLKVDEESNTMSAKILDDELDLLDCNFSDGSVEIDVSNYTYITLNADNLSKLLALINEAEACID